MLKDPNTRQPGFRLALIGCLVAIMVLGLGAFTRLVDAGLGCPDWPTCYGHMTWPKSAEDVHQANQAFPEMPVEHDKTWPEMVHRYFAQSLGLITIALFVLAIRQRRESQPVALVSALLAVNVALTVVTAIVGTVMEPYAVGSVAVTMATLAWLGIKRGNSAYPFKLPAFLLAFIILQGLFGMWTVTLKLWPQVVTSHLLGGFTTFSLLWLLTQRLGGYHWHLPAAAFTALARLRPWVVVGLVILCLQIALGGWTTSNYAAVACPDLPTCQGQWLPPMQFSDGFNVAQTIGPNYLGGTMDNEARVAIHFSHRIGAIITTAYLLWLGFLLWTRVRAAPVAGFVKVLLPVLVLQVLLGLSNIVFQFPVSVAVAHNLVGAVLLLVMVTLCHRTFTARRQTGEYD